MVEPYGGRLVDRQVSDSERDRRDGELRDLPTVHPLIDQLYDAEKIGIGAYSPLDGFMDSASIASVLAKGRLPTGLPWSIPIHFPIPPEPSVAGLGPGDAVGLLDPSDRLVGILHIDEKFPLDRPAIARGAYGTDDPNHPNVADLLNGGDTAWSGRVDLLRRLLPPWDRAELSPAEARADFARRGWKNVAAYQCRNPPHTAHEYIQRLTLEREDVDGLFIHPVVGRLKKGDYKPEVILAAYDALVQNYYPPDRVALSPLTITMRYGGPKATLFLAIVRRNYGCGSYIVGRDQAGVGKYYDPFACHRIFDEFDIGVQPLRYGESFFCRHCGWMASRKTCSHPVSEHTATSQTRIREALISGTPLPADILRPEVAAILGRPGGEVTN
ncbi:MAG: sulfate adenylyltransferase [Thermoplasmata archaeon]|jgi:sulfate adenylyltransferase|nr:sulfate adenylyltransferase [Thermoplasmata archaeon]